ncbi:hypothetical protein B1964_07030 [Gordonia sp. i37]|nr:hypothetical protein B1964_07030 [Gordonia sp. i37]
MRWDESTRTLELSERNVAVLRLKLTDPLSARMIQTGCGRIIARAIADDDEGATEVVPAVAEGVVTLTASELERLSTVGTSVVVADVTVSSVPNSKHYGDRPPGAMYMPTSGDIV